MRYLKRVFVSFDGKCPMECKHCYTYEISRSCKTKSQRSIPELVQSIESDEFDVVYVSQSYENFQNDEQGVALCSALYERYKKDIFIISRCAFSEGAVNQLHRLNQKMGASGNRLFVAASICADGSYGRTENIWKCPTPDERICNLKNLHKNGISTLLLIRPLFPDRIIPVSECVSLIEKSRSDIDAVISSGLIVTEGILRRLGIDSGELNYLTAGDSEYLADLDKERVQYVDVSEELKVLSSVCKRLELPFFQHSLPALNAIPF